MNAKEKWSISSLLRNATASKVLSVILAVLLWFFVVYAIDNEDTKTIDGVPVFIDQAALQSLGLSIIEGDEVTMTVEVSGKRFDIGNLSREDIRLRTFLTPVKGAGQYELAVEPIAPAGDRYTVQIKGPSSIWVTFDRMLEKEIPIEFDSFGISVPDGYLLGEVELSPGELTIRGPQNDVTKVHRAVVQYGGEGQSLTNSLVVKGEVQLLDREGNAVASEHLVTSLSAVDIIVPVKKIAELPLRLGLNNLPKGIDKEDLNYFMSPETIQVAAPEEVLRSIFEIRVGDINFESLDLTKQGIYSFPINLPDSFVNINYVDEAVVEFDNSGYTEQFLNLNNFVISNVPPGYEAHVVTSAINFVKFIGTETAMRNIKSSDFIVEIDLSDREIRLASYEMPVKIYAPERGLVWAVGSYSVVIEVKETP